MSFPTPDEIDARRLKRLGPVVDEIKAFIENALMNGDNEPYTSQGKWPRDAIDEAERQIDAAGWDIEDDIVEEALTFRVVRKNQPNGPQPKNQRKIQSRQTLER